VNLLLDTHIWIWSLMEPARLSRRVMREIRSSRSELWLSAISVWEFAILVERNRIALETSTGEWLDRALGTGTIREAPVTFEIARESRVIELPHQDPADRFIAATARVLDLTLITADERILGSRVCRTIANS
jgi:PIN domain nuclease of toxin-antitoxin system